MTDSMDSTGTAQGTEPSRPSPEPSRPSAPVSETAPAAALPAPGADHTYDGITEYDNPLPGWWVAIFWASIAFAPFYAIYYHGGTGRLIADDHARELKAHAEAEAALALASGAVDEGTLAALGRDAVTLEEGAALYKQNCAVCHSDRGEGKIGPNLTDDAWLHGGALVDIHRTIDQGVPEKGMVAWGKQLPADAVKKLTAFVGGHLRGTNVPGLPQQGTPSKP